MIIKTIAAAAVGLASISQAQVTVSTPELTLTTLPESDFFNNGPQQFSLLSSAGGVTRLAMTSLATLMNTAASAQLGREGGDQYRADFNAVVNSGYRVTGYSFDSTVVGSLVAPPLPAGAQSYDVAAAASNRAISQVYSAASFGGTPIDSALSGASELLGSVPLHVEGVQGLSLTGSFILGVFASVFASAADGYYYPAGGGQPVLLAASAGIRFTDPVLTIYTQPVPEPATYLLLGTGLLALVAGVRRRHRDQS